MSTLRLVSHNVFWGQGAPFDTDQPGPVRSDIVNQLTELLLESNPDVLCLQEVQSASTFSSWSATMEAPGVYCPGLELVQYGGAILSKLSSAVTDATSAVARPQRMWQLVEFPFGASSVRIANVHLPSARQVGQAQAAKDRVSELTIILSHRPSVVVGDFNEQPGGGVDELMGSAGFLDAAVVTGSGDLPTSLGGGRGDRVWVHESLVGSLIEYGVLGKSELATDLDMTDYLSDHLPLWIVLDSDAMGG